MSSAEAPGAGGFPFPGADASNRERPARWTPSTSRRSSAIVIRNAMERFGGNVSKVARELGI